MRIEKVTVEVYDDEEIAVTFYRGDVQRQYVIYHTVIMKGMKKPRVFLPPYSKHRLYGAVKRMCKNDDFYLSDIKTYSWTIERRLFDPGR